jgi:hypothetical protein
MCLDLNNESQNVNCIDFQSYLLHYCTDNDATKVFSTVLTIQLNFWISYFYRCTVHFDICGVHSPTNALNIQLEKALKFTLKFTRSLLLRVSVYDRHQGAYAGAWLKLYVT